MRSLQKSFHAKNYTVKNFYISSSVCWQHGTSNYHLRPVHVAKQLPSDFGPTWDVIVVEARPFRSETTAALSSQASSCLRAGHGTDIDNTVESDLPLVMGSQIVVWKADTVEGLGGLASMRFR